MVRPILKLTALSALLLCAACGVAPQNVQLDTLATTFPVTGVTAPGGVIKLGSSFWVSDHLLGFCRMDDGGVNQATCVADAASAGQASAAGGFVFVPDNSSQGEAVWRYTFDPLSGTLSAPARIQVLADRSRPSATAVVGNDVYVGYIRSGVIERIVGGAAGGTAVAPVGGTSDGGGVGGLAAVGGDLYLAEEGAVTKLAGVAGCAGTCIAASTVSQAALPLSITASGTDLFIGDLERILHLDTLSGAEEAWAAGFAFPTGLAAEPSAFEGDGDPAHDFVVYVGDDPTEGDFVAQGYVKAVYFGDDGGGVAEEPLTTGTKLATGLTAPGGLVRLPLNSGGFNWWVSDHTLGFCRMQTGPNGLLTVVNQTTCFSPANLASPGQASFDAARNLVYVPDNSSKGRGVWRIVYNPATGLLGRGTLINLGTNRATATALRANGNTLYVGYLKSARITRIQNPSALSPTVTLNWGRTGDGRGAVSLALGDVNDGFNAPYNALYLAATAAVKTIPLSCAAACLATDTTIAAAAPLALASNGNNLIFVADGPLGNRVLRYHVATDATDLLATSGTAPERGFKFISALTYYRQGGVARVVAADDPTEAAQLFQGVAWDITLP